MLDSTAFHLSLRNCNDFTGNPRVCNRQGVICQKDLPEIDAFARFCRPKARIFFRNSVGTGELYPCESTERLCDVLKTGDVVTLG